MIRHQAAGQPHHLDTAPGLPFESSARLDPVQVAVDIELRQRARMIAWPGRRLRHNPTKPQAAKIEFIDKNIDHPNRIVVTDPIFQPIGKQGALPAIHPSTKRFIKPSRQSTGES